MPITGLIVADRKSIGHDYHMEIKTERDHPLLMQSAPKHDPPLTRVYKRFLELPVPVVLALMWLAGAALLSVCGLVLYHLWL